MEFYTCIAKYAFFGIRDEKLLATARKSWYHTMVCSGIEAVITGLTRNFTATWSFRPPEILDFKGFSKLKIEYFSVFSPAFLSKNFLS